MAHVLLCAPSYQSPERRDLATWTEVRNLKPGPWLSQSAECPRITTGMYINIYVYNFYA